MLYLEDKWAIHYVTSCDFDHRKGDDDKYLAKFLLDKRL